MRTLILAPTRVAAEMWAGRNGIRDWLPLDARFRLDGYDPLGAEVVVLDGGGSRFDTAVLLDHARRRGIHIRHDRSVSPALRP